MDPTPKANCIGDAHSPTSRPRELLGRWADNRTTSRITSLAMWSCSGAAIGIALQGLMPESQDIHLPAIITLCMATLLLGNFQDALRALGQAGQGGNWRLIRTAGLFALAVSVSVAAWKDSLHPYSPEVILSLGGIALLAVYNLRWMIRNSIG